MDDLAIVRAVHFAATIAVFGELAYTLLLSRGHVRPPRFVAMTAWSLAVVAVSALAWLALEARDMSGLPLREALSAETLDMVITQTLFGQLWLARMALAAALAVALYFLRDGSRDTGGALALVIALVLLATLAGMGHAAAGRGAARSVRLAVDALHLVAAGAWLGTLPPLAMAIGAAIRSADADSLDRVREATRRYSALGIAAVGTLIVSGLANVSYNNVAFTAEGVGDLYGSQYGHLLFAKLALFLVMIAFAAVNRLRLAPRLDAPAVFRTLRRNAVAELLLGLAIVTIVGELGITTPPTPHAAHHAATTPRALE